MNITGNLSEPRAQSPARGEAPRCLSAYQSQKSTPWELTQLWITINSGDKETVLRRKVEKSQPRPQPHGAPGIVQNPCHPVSWLEAAAAACGGHRTLTPAGHSSWLLPCLLASLSCLFPSDRLCAQGRVLKYLNQINIYIFFSCKNL